MPRPPTPSLSSAAWRSASRSTSGPRDRRRGCTPSAPTTAPTSPSPTPTAMAGWSRRSSTTSAELRASASRLPGRPALVGGVIRQTYRGFGVDAHYEDVARVFGGAAEDERTAVSGPAGAHVGRQLWLDEPVLATIGAGQSEPVRS